MGFELIIKALMTNVNATSFNIISESQDQHKGKTCVIRTINFVLATNLFKIMSMIKRINVNVSYQWFNDGTIISSERNKLPRRQSTQTINDYSCSVNAVT